MADPANPTPEGGATATPTPEPVTPTGTVQPGSEAGQSAPTEESFTKFDVNTLPPQLRSMHDNMLRDYKSKTTQLAEERKKYEGYDAYKQKAEQFEQISANQEFVKRWNEFVQEQNTKGDPQDPTQAKLQEFEKQLQEERKARVEREMSEVVDAFSNAKDEKGELVNSDFNSLNEIAVGKNSQGDEYSLLRTCIELSEGKTSQERLANGYKNAKAIRDKIFEEGRKHGMGKMLSKVRNGTEPPTVTSDKTVFNGDPTKISVREARELALKGVVVK